MWLLVRPGEHSHLVNLAAFPVLQVRQNVFDPGVYELIASQGLEEEGIVLGRFPSGGEAEAVLRDIASALGRAVPFLDLTQPKGRLSGSTL